MNNIKKIIQQKPANNSNIIAIKYSCAWDQSITISEKKHKCLQKIKLCKKCGNFLCSRHITTNLNECVMCKYSDDKNRFISARHICKKCGILIKSYENRSCGCSFGYLCSDCSKKKYSHEETCFQI